MPASNALVNRISRSRNPERDLRAAYDTGEYQPDSGRPSTVIRNGQERRRIRGVGIADRYASYRKYGMGGNTSLPPAVDQLASQRNADGSLKPDADMVDLGGGRQMTKSAYAEREASRPRPRLRRERRMAEAKPAAESPADDSIGGAMSGSAIDKPAPSARRMRAPRKESMIDGKPSSQFFSEAAQRQKQDNAFAKYVPPPEPKKKTSRMKRPA